MYQKTRARLSRVVPVTNTSESSRNQSVRGTDKQLLIIFNGILAALCRQDMKIDTQNQHQKATRSDANNDCLMADMCIAEHVQFLVVLKLSGIKER